MKHKKYRICLIMVAAAAAIGGILYYCTCMRDEDSPQKSALVRQMQEKNNRLKEAGRQATADVRQAFVRTGEEFRDAAAAAGREWKEAAAHAGEEIRQGLSGEEDV